MLRTMKTWVTSALVTLVASAWLASCTQKGQPRCYREGDQTICKLPDGRCDDGAGNIIPCTGREDPPVEPPIVIPPTPTTCKCDETPITNDDDRDCITNAVESAGPTSETNPDSDGDGIWDGCEDRNHNGVRDPGELDAMNPDTDGDGLADGVEDTNKDGKRQAASETSALSADSDGDGIVDGTEDRNHDGVVAIWDTNGNGCRDAGEPDGEGDPRRGDSDADGVPDRVEDRDHDGLCDAGETCFWVPDSDCDGLVDGNEDHNGDGFVNQNDTDPLDPDTDGDCVADGLEDTNRNGSFDSLTETSPLLPDSDGDGIFDGVEDRNCNGEVDDSDDLPTSDGCYQHGEVEGESDPRSADSDEDGIFDDDEDKDHDGYCIRPSSPPGSTFTETCAWHRDTDCDGVGDGDEDTNGNGLPDMGELDPRNPDTDRDGLPDGCRPAAGGRCEDKNNDGFVASNETDPLNFDTDADGLADGCELDFVGGVTNPLDEDSDGDGKLDGDEDVNHDCEKQPAETDPRLADPPPAGGSFDNAEWQVCGAQNLKQLTFARTTRPELDYQLAFEVERNGDSPPRESLYLITAFGKSDGVGGFDPEDPRDALWGHYFQSGVGAVSDATGVVNRLVYGFIVGANDARPLDDMLDGLREALVARYPNVTEAPAQTARPAHDSLPNFPILRAQRRFSINVGSTPVRAYQLRNDMLRHVFLGGQQTEPPLPFSDPVTAEAHTLFTVYVGSVQRTRQLGAGNAPTVLTVVALTPDESALTYPEAKRSRYADRESRLEDLTGGSALARSANKISNDCEKKNVRKAVADLLWVVDDSASMQSQIKRLQNAASDARAVLTANANIVDFRVAMTTTNPSKAARAQCWLGCPNTCAGVPATTCYEQCADQHLGCLPFYDPTTSPAGLIANINNDLTDFALPGGGGTFYAENSKYLDCDSSSNSGQTEFINHCGSPAYGTEFAPFTATTVLANKGFRGSDASGCDASLALMDLSERANTASNDCASTPTPTSCCPRLTVECNDGPTVLESQMCDLIRAMGGLPDANNTTQRSTGRAHASPEVGTRTVRKLLDAMRVALPKNSADALRGERLRRTCCETCDPATQPCADTCCTPCDARTCPVGNPSCCSHPSLGLDCDIRGAGQCSPCDPLVDPTGCKTVPLVTVFLSDEEDYWFKDECRVKVTPGAGPSSLLVDGNETDRVPLNTRCRYLDGDPSTLEPCTEAYCTGSSFVLEPPFGYNPDFPVWNQDRFSSIRQRPWCYGLSQVSCGGTDGCTWTGTACTTRDLACSPAFADRNTSCVGDPCPYLRDQTSCNSYSGFFNDSKFDSIRAQLPSVSLCTWDATTSMCFSACAYYTRADGNVTMNGGAVYDARKTQCEADPRCEWDASRLDPVNDGGSLRNACRLKLELNDCRACKRWKRLQAALDGESGVGSRCALYTDQGRCDAAFMCGWSGGACTAKTLVGMAFAGPAYAVVRDAGKPGMGEYTSATANKPSTADACQGASNTWGRGDGSSYRDIAIATQGRTQDVCAGSYKGFMQQLVLDIVALSAPYELRHAPIAATIKVGRARPMPGGSFQYEEVPRSLSRGFHYNATKNSLGFKNDPIDGDCTYDQNPGAPGHLCAADNRIDAGEISSAQNVPFMPRDKDLVIVSYRYWLPVPCHGMCLENETCARVLCAPGMTPAACSSEGFCPDVKDTCTAGECACVDGDVVERCVPEPCPQCQYYNPGTHACAPVPPQPNECLCTTGEQNPCSPGGPNVCPFGQGCSETLCVCEGTGTCPGVAFDANGEFSIAGSCNPLSSCAECVAALDCCADWRRIANLCGVPTGQAACEVVRDNGVAVCQWIERAQRCMSLVPSPCCGPGEQPRCVLAESGRASVACLGGTCECAGAVCNTACEGAAGQAACNGLSNCTWTGTECRASTCQSFQSCGADSRCTPACNPALEHCDVARGCICTPNAG